MDLLYGNSIGISAKKSSSYSSSLIARMARLASGGFREGGNLPFCSHASTGVDKSVTNDTKFNERLFTFCYQFLDTFDSDLQILMEHCLQRWWIKPNKRMRSQQTHLVNDLHPLTAFRCAILSFSFLTSIFIC